MSWDWTVLLKTWITAVVGTIAFLFLKRFCDQQDRDRYQRRIDEAAEAEQEETKWRRRARWRS